MNVPKASNSSTSDSDYYNEHGDPVDAHMVNVQDNKCKHLMALDIGRFQWTQLPMGSIIAQDVFQRKLDGIFLDVPGVTGIADDMIIYGRNDQEHNGNLLNFLEVCRNNNLTLNAEKI